MICCNRYILFHYLLLILFHLNHVHIFHFKLIFNIFNQISKCARKLTRFIYFIPHAATLVTIVIFQLRQCKIYTTYFKYTVSLRLKRFMFLKKTNCLFECFFFLCQLAGRVLFAFCIKVPGFANSNFSCFRSVTVTVHM